MSQSLENDNNDDDRQSTSLLNGNNWHLRNYDDVIHHQHHEHDDDNVAKANDDSTIATATHFNKVQSSSTLCRSVDFHQTPNTIASILPKNAQTLDMFDSSYDECKVEKVRRSARIKQYSTSRNMRNIHNEQDYIYDWPGSGYHFPHSHLHLSDQVTIKTGTANKSPNFLKTQQLITNQQSSSPEVITETIICNGYHLDDQPNKKKLRRNEDITNESLVVNCTECTKNKLDKSRLKMKYNVENENGYDIGMEIDIKTSLSVTMTASGICSVTGINIDKDNNHTLSLVPTVIGGCDDKDGHICNGEDHGPTAIKLSSSDDYELSTMDEQLPTESVKSKNTSETKHPIESITFNISRPLFNFKTHHTSNQIIFKELIREIKTAKQLSQRGRKRKKHRITGKVNQKLRLLNQKEIYKSPKSVENCHKDSRKIAKRPVRMQPRMDVFNVAHNVKNNDDVILLENVNFKSNKHPMEKVQIEKNESNNEDRFFRKFIRKLYTKNTQLQSASIKTNNISDPNIVNDENLNRITTNHTPAASAIQKHPLAKKSIVKRLINQTVNSTTTANKSDVDADANKKFEFGNNKIDFKDQLIGKNFFMYQRLFQLYKLCEYNHLDRPLYLTSSLSYMKHFQCEYNAAFKRHDHSNSNLNGNIQLDNGDSCNNSNGNNDIDMDHNQQSTHNPIIPDINGQSADKDKNNIDVNGSNDDQDERIVSTSLVLDPLALNSITGYEYATIDFFVLRRQGPNTMLDSDLFDDSKIYVGTSCVHFGSKSSRIINNRIIIPIKLLFELDQINSNEFIHSSEDHKYFINAVVTYFRSHSQLKSQFMANCKRLNGQNKPNNVRNSTQNKSNKKPILDGHRGKSKSVDVLSSKTIDHNNLNDKMEFHFGFELENIEDIHYAKELPNCHDKQIINNNKYRKRRSQLIKGEETHMLCQSEMTLSGHRRRMNIVTELNKWHRITSDDIFYRDNSKDSYCGYYGFGDCKCKLRSSRRNGNQNKQQIDVNFITFRLLRTNLSNDNNDGDYSGYVKKLFGNNGNQQVISSKQLISIFNGGQFTTWKKLAQARSQNDDDKTIDCPDSQLKNQRVLRANTRRQAAAAAAASVSGQNLINGHVAPRNASKPKLIIPRLLHETDSFKIIYEFSQIQSNLVSEDISCPLCLRQFVMLAQLGVHLKTNHERFIFKMSMDPMNNFISIHVGINKQFDPTFETDPLFKALNFCPQQQRTRRQWLSRMRCTRPERRPTTNHQPTTMMISIGRDHRSLCTMFTYNDESRYYQIDVNSRIGSYEALSQRRVFYHSRTMLPILPAEMNDDSETDEIQWRMRQKRHMMQDFIDVNPGEKTVMGLWNQFIMKYRNRYFADCHMADAVKNFMIINTPMLIRCNLRHNCILHLINMYRYKCIDQDVVENSVRYLNKMQSYYNRCQEMLQRREQSLDRLPDSLVRLMQYFRVVDAPIEYIDISFDDDEKNRQLYDICIVAKLFEQSEIDQIFGSDAHLFLRNKSKTERTIRMVNNLEAIALIALLSLGDGDNVRNTVTLYRGYDQLEKHLQRIKQSYDSDRMAENYLNQKVQNFHYD
ncbi:hypothetical protein HUG17_0415 [Dermatophagoides farinae]|uniref:C2H2-type domain-containing protein n=1 Tax=Dermatophagoides farinae TaxID=6954 RepID=A0A9D4P6X5_DERFA|nr:hypothetical protein HUG17_0415 [Dermatophagoides farinae]